MRTMCPRILAEKMWCTDCDTAFSFRYVEEEKRIGLASVYKIRCHQCLNIYVLPTSTKTTSSNHSHEFRNCQYSINVKAAAAVIDSGLGSSQLNTVLSELNIPPISSSILGRHERVVENALKKLRKSNSRRKTVNNKREWITVVRGSSVLLPRIPMIPSDSPIPFKHLQFSIRLAYVMTINKSQGQTMTICGQLYVACSRVGKPSNLFVYTPQGLTKNIVHPIALR
ncbi:uncharacterized protein LOC123302390 [Chrysoperla carnea]|uniref:uncharacterized protein LOC123302390 n=1 Tax=Chrysoperla carnea TaxID=189513 RepID=UPI001D08A98A|nr:uncharacterized protein LOC123302390 [Chrysoperla carnea]